MSRGRQTADTVLLELASNRANLFDAAVQVHEQQFDFKARMTIMRFFGQLIEYAGMHRALLFWIFRAIGPNESLAGTTVTVIDHNDLPDAVK